MPSPIEQTLHTLLPTCNVLPDQLITLATSLLAQSKAAAPTLKPDEEIARPYASCHIACERLANKLALDISRTAPPCGPRVYKKLHGFLDGVLTAGKTQTAPTRKGKGTDDRPAQQTPRSSIKKSESGARSVRSTPAITPDTLGKRKRQSKESGAKNVYAQVIQLGEHLCKSSGFQEASSHVSSGLHSIFGETWLLRAADTQTETPGKRRKNPKRTGLDTEHEQYLEMVESDKLPLLAIAIVQIVTGKIRKSEYSADEKETMFGETLAYLQKHDEDLAMLVYADRYETLAAEIDEFADRVLSGKLSRKWYDDIQAQDDGTLDDENDTDRRTTVKIDAKTPLRRKEKHAASRENENDPGEAGLLPGLGTMFQDAVDWLSEERKAEYVRWKRGIMKQITTIEQAA